MCEGTGAPSVCRSPGCDCSAGTSCPLLPSSVQTVWVQQQVKPNNNDNDHHSLSPHLASASTARRGRPTGATWQPAGPTASRWGRGATPVTSLSPGPSTWPGTGGLSFTVWRITGSPGSTPMMTTAPGGEEISDTTSERIAWSPALV